MKLNDIEFLSRLAGSRSVLIAGAGGGFDVYCGLPLYFFLKDLGKEVHLANLSFTNLAEVRGETIDRHVVKVDADTEGPAHYFPERALMRWFRSRGQPTAIYCLEKVGSQPLRHAYQALQATLGFDSIVLVDGGTDILMRGDECDLGTPQEDLTSVSAATALDLKTKLVLCLGFGIDRHHGVCHAHFLENVAAMAREGGFLGTLSLLEHMPEVARYREAVAFATEQMPRSPSIVSTSIVAAIEGEYGDVHRTERTQGSKLWINPLMGMYWGFDLDAVARRCLYLDLISETETAFEVHAIIERFRSPTLKLREREDIPV